MSGTILPPRPLCKAITRTEDGYVVHTVEGHDVRCDITALTTWLRAQRPPSQEMKKWQVEPKS